MIIEYYQVNAFTDNEEGGNPAGVVVNTTNLSAEHMQVIAKELGFSETAFVCIGGNSYDFEVRFFTPTEEVDLCGHATIATFALLKSLGKLSGKKILTQKTKAGILKVELKDGLVMMDQAEPQQINQLIDQKQLCKIMNLDIDYLGIGGLMTQAEIWSTGLKDVLLPVKNKVTLMALNPQMDLLSTYSHEIDVIGVHAFTIEDEKIWCRNFAPGCGIPEEAATGTSNGALGACLKDKGYGKEFDFCAYQGYWMGSKSQIVVSVSDKVSVGGKAVIINHSTVDIPN